jgi:membrane-bound metal-dependent hydrolase YbcI (DUF457 family)
MLGRTHALSGALAWAAVCTSAPAVGVRPGWPAAILGLVSTAGAALLPDLDHPDATIAHTFGPVSKAAADLVHRLSGGHRHATHSLAFAVIAPLALWPLILIGGYWVALPLLAVLGAFAMRALHVGRALIPLGMLAIPAVAWFLLHRDLGWLALSVAAGILAHLAGDCLTREGCPLLWPRKRHYMLAAIQRTGNAVERWLFAPLFGIGTIALIALPALTR